MNSPKKEEKVPIFKSWKGWYILSFVFLIALILLFYILTVLFNE